MKTRILFFVALLIVIVYCLFYIWSMSQSDYGRNCLSGFSIEKNIKGIASYYNNIGKAEIKESDIEITNVIKGEGSGYDYEYSILDGRASGFATGNNCGYEEISPKSSELLK